MVRVDKDKASTRWKDDKEEDEGREKQPRRRQIEGSEINSYCRFQPTFSLP